MLALAGALLSGLMCRKISNRVARSVTILLMIVSVIGAGLALLETVSAKMRIFRAPEFLGAAFMLAVLAMLIHLLLEHG